MKSIIFISLRIIITGKRVNKKSNQAPVSSVFTNNKIQICKTKSHNKLQKNESYAKAFTDGLHNGKSCNRQLSCNYIFTTIIGKKKSKKSWRNQFHGLWIKLIFPSLVESLPQSFSPLTTETKLISPKAFTGYKFRAFLQIYHLWVKKPRFSVVYG